MPSRGIRALHEPDMAFMVCGLLFNDLSVADMAIDMLEQRFGPVTLTSLLYPFNETDYYCKEIGNNITRLFIIFKRLIDQEKLAGIKIKCREIEFHFARNRQRPVNIDPGILSAERLVLATSKNFIHRIYLGRGVYADLTLIYYRKSFRPLQWTFPDYAKQETIEFWNMVRKLFMSRNRRRPLPEYKQYKNNVPW